MFPSENGSKVKYQVRTHVLMPNTHGVRILRTHVRIVRTHVRTHNTHVRMHAYAQCAYACVCIRTHVRTHIIFVLYKKIRLA